MSSKSACTTTRAILLGKIIALMRERSKIRLYDAACELGITDETLALVEAGKSDVGYSVLWKFSAMIQRSPSDLCRYCEALESMVDVLYGCKFREDDARGPLLPSSSITSCALDVIQALEGNRPVHDATVWSLSVVE